MRLGDMTSDSQYGAGTHGASRDGADLQRRLQQAQARHAAGSADDGDERDSSALGLAMRMGVELVLSVCVAVFIGWFLDEWLGTAPWLLLLFVPLGIVAGIMNVVRTAKSMQRPAAAETTPEKRQC